MTEQQLITRASNFANNMKNINRFLVVDKDTLELYGTKTFVVNQKNLRQYYEYHEPNSAWRNWDVFYTEFQNRVDEHLMYH